MNQSRTKSYRSMTFAIFLFASIAAVNPATAENAERASNSSNGKIKLQIRISEARKKKDSTRYYKSLARQQKKKSGVRVFSQRDIRSQDH